MAERRREGGYGQRRAFELLCGCYGFDASVDSMAAMGAPEKVFGCSWPQKSDGHNGAVGLKKEVGIFC
ncbi:MAG: hypothetical protein VYA34_02610 [Myxococcota bacterium]|nr:hypothetical protein [Myxococcota bacterium]